MNTHTHCNTVATLKRWFLTLPAFTAIGCISAPTPLPNVPQQVAVHAPASSPLPKSPAPAIQQAAYQLTEPATTSSGNTPVSTTDPVAGNLRNPGLPELLQLTMDHHPRLAQVTWAVESARGRAIQARLYPNPTISIIGDEIGDRQGPAGILSLPHLSQEIVRGGKLKLAQAAALKEVDQATWEIVDQRYRLFTDVRRNYVEVVTLQRRIEVLQELITLADQSVLNAQKLLNAKEGSELDVIQLEVDRERYRAELDSTQRALPAAFRRLAASTGINDLPQSPLTGDLEVPLPEYHLDQLTAYVLAVHPQVRVAQLGVERSRLLVRRAEVEPIPNITVGASYVRQNQNKSNDYSLSASMPIPVWDQNQGQIRAARAQLNEAMQETLRVQTDLAGRIAASFTTYSASRARAEKYRSAILPRANKSLQLAQKAYQGGQFEYLRVLQSQRAVAEARLEHLRSLGEMWGAASEIAGFTLEDQWPPINVAAPASAAPVPVVVPDVLAVPQPKMQEPQAPPPKTKVPNELGNQPGAEP